MLGQTELGGSCLRRREVGDSMLRRWELGGSRPTIRHEEVRLLQVVRDIAERL